MKRWPWLAIGILLAVLIPLCLGGNDMLGRLQQFPAPLWPAMFAMIGLCWCINALRLRLLLGAMADRLSLRHCLGTVMATEFAICATPGGTGGPLTLLALLGRQGIRPARASAVFAMDQLSDLVFFLFALAGIFVYALSHHLNHSLQWLLTLSALLMIGGLVAGVAVVRWHRRVLRFNGRVLRLLGVTGHTRRRWARKLLHFLEAFSDTCALPRRTLVKVFLLTCLHWAVRYSVLYLALRGLGSDVQWAWTFLIQMLSLSAGQFSLLPGGAGAAELTSAALLAPMVGTSTAAAAILIWRVVTYYFYLLAGGPVFAVMLGKPLLRKLGVVS